MEQKKKSSKSKSKDKEEQKVESTIDIEKLKKKAIVKP